MKKIVMGTLIPAILVVFTAASAAQEGVLKKTAITGVRAETMGQLNDAAKKMVALAEAIPEDKYSWRPAEGVRSVSEVFMHIAGANYFLPVFAGVKAEGYEGNEGFKKLQALEKITEKQKVIYELKKSYDHARMAISKTKDSDLDKKANFFGNETTVRGILILVAVHCHEHLGQSIAYARINGIVPPWSVVDGQ